MRTKDPDTLKAIYDYYVSYYTIHECSPSVSNVASEIGISSSTAHKYIRTLVQERKLEQIDARGYKPLNSKLIASTEVPKVGYVSCGLPATSEENIEGYVQMPQWFFKTKQPYFFLQASGDSMVEAGINDGDLVLIRQQETAEEGNIIVALTEDGESTLKTLYFDNAHGKIVLHPENKKYDDIYLDCVKIQGVVEKVIKEYN